MFELSSYISTGDYIIKGVHTMPQHVALVLRTLVVD